MMEKISDHSNEIEEGLKVGYQEWYKRISELKELFQDMNVVPCLSGHRPKIYLYFASGKPNKALPLLHTY